MRLLAGTSGFAYKEWKGPFYPEDLRDDAMLGYYAGRLPAVEINNTFYRMPRESVVAAWADQVPDGFRFVLKASRKITHFGRLKNVESELEYFLRASTVLGPKRLVRRPERALVRRSAPSDTLISAPASECERPKSSTKVAINGGTAKTVM